MVGYPVDDFGVYHDLVGRYLDYLHFVVGSDQRAVLEEMRLNFIEIKNIVDWPRMERYLRLFSSPKLERAAQLLKEMADA